MCSYTLAKIKRKEEFAVPGKGAMYTAAIFLENCRKVYRKLCPRYIIHPVLYQIYHPVLYQIYYIIHPVLYTLSCTMQIHPVLYQEISLFFHACST